MLFSFNVLPFPATPQDLKPFGKGRVFVHGLPAQTVGAPPLGGHGGVYLLKEKLTSVPGTRGFCVEVQPAQRGAGLAAGVNESFATDLEGSRISPLTIQ